MVYSSLLYIYGFLPISLLLYYLTPKKMREAALLVFSIIFCGMISLYFLVFVLVYTAVNYSCILLIQKNDKNEKIAAVPLTFGILFDLLALFTFRT